MIPSEVRNKLIDALERSSEPPFMGRAAYADRRRVEADYKAIHDALTAIDEWMRGWKPVDVREMLPK